NHGLIAAGETAAAVIAAHERLLGAAEGYFGEPFVRAGRAELLRARGGVRPLVPDDVVYGLHEARPAGSPGGRAAMMREEQLLAHVLVRLLIARRGRPRCLPACEIERLSSMEAELFRRI